MKIALFQFDIAWENPQENLKKIDKALEELTGRCDIIVLPEMFTTGFTIKPSSIAENMNGSSIAWLKEASVKYDIAIMGSIIISENNTNYNRMIFITPDGMVDYYDKRHLFRMSGEDINFSAGQSRKIFKYMGFNILPQVCYDLRFPIWSRNISNQYDIAIYIASWPIPRIKVWDILLQARALENICYVIGVNRVGVDPTIGYNGHSCVIDYLGNRVAEIAENLEQYTIYEVDKKSLEKFRDKFPAHLDSDKFTIDY